MTLYRRLLLAASALLAPPLLAATAQAGTAPPQDLQVIDRRTGFGEIAGRGRTVIVHYTGWLFDPARPDNKGQKFDSSRDRGTPLSFQLGAGKVIAGWDEGVAGMKVGGQRTLIIPPDLAYGARGAGGAIPPNATLVFDVELIGVR
jgi:FKBP-type peptidyl-prolyl cis-trans isomerase